MATSISAKVVQFLDKVLFKQTDLIREVTYRQKIGVEYNEDLKRSVAVYIDTTLDAVVIGDLSSKSGVSRAQGYIPPKTELPIRGRGFVIRASDMVSDYVPEKALDDLFQVENQEYKVLNVEKILEVAYFVKVEL